MKINVWNSPRKRKFIKWAIGLFMAYTILGFLILPPIVRVVAEKQLSAQLNRKVSIQTVKINPYVPSVTILGLLILDKDGQPFVSWDKVYVSFRVTSIFTKTLTFGSIEVVKPFARAQMNKDYSFNFSDLITKFTSGAPSPAPKQPSNPFFLRVKQLSITNAMVSVADYTVRIPFRRIIGPVNVTLENFQTRPEGNGTYSIAGTSDAGEDFSWRGNFCLVPLRSDGRLTVDHITLNKFAPLYQDIVNFEIRSGQIGVHAEYHFEWSPSNHEIIVTNADYALRHFQLAQPGSTNDIVEVFHLSVTGANADLQAHRAEIGRIFSSGAKLFVERDRNKTVNVVELATPKENPANASGAILLLLRSVTNTVAMLINTTNQWNATIDEVLFTNCEARLEDDANSRPATLNLDHINFTAKNISNVPNTNLTSELSLDWNTNGTIHVVTTASISPLAADVHLDLENLGLNTLDPYLESQANLLIPEASFGLNGDVQARTPPGSLPEVKFDGDLWLNDFRAVDGGTAEDLLKWDSIRVSGIDANLNPPMVSIKQILVDGVSVNAVMETNKTINLLEALHPAMSGPVTTNAPVIAKNAAVPGTNALAALPPVSISAIVITNTQVHFTDRSLTPNVNLLIEQAEGSISGISTTELQHGDVDLHALVDGVGPAKITGHINPFSGTQTNHLTIQLASMDLVPTSPYSGKFAGYRIARGNLYLDLEYDLVGRKLKSKNVITLDQFTFGDKVNSPDATKLPVRLAIAILKDRQGKIVLDVPIEGSLDDPKFRIGKVVTRALLNILTKVATSPFSLLGAAFGGGGEELSYQDFAPGSAELTDSNRKKLDVLVKALYGRPGLQLQLSGSIDPVNDRDGLQRAALDKEIRTRQWASLSRSKQALTTPDEIVLTPQQRSHWIKKLYNEAQADGKITPAILAANTNLAAIAAQIKPPKNEKLARLLVKSSTPASKTPVAVSSQPRLPPLTDPKEALLVAIIPVSESDLETLAIERAKAVRAYILQSGKVEASRLFLEQNRTGGLRQDGSRVYLELN
jgi:hypothetical protein